MCDFWSDSNVDSNVDTSRCQDDEQLGPGGRWTDTTP